LLSGFAEVTQSYRHRFREEVAGLSEFVDMVKSPDARFRWGEAEMWKILETEATPGDGRV
jgi:hypothetical protein